MEIKAVLEKAKVAVLFLSRYFLALKSSRTRSKAEPRFWSRPFEESRKHMVKKKWGVGASAKRVPLLFA